MVSKNSKKVNCIESQQQYLYNSCKAVLTYTPKLVILKPKSKDPLLDGHGKLITSNNPTEIHGFIKKGYNIGMNTIDIGVLDLDEHDGKPYVIPSHINIDQPRTWQVISGGEGNGRHVYYKKPPNSNFGNGVEKFTEAGFENVDIRFNPNSYVLLPGCIHPDTGDIYKWREGYSPDDCELANTTEWCLSLLTTVGSTESPNIELDTSITEEYLREKINKLERVYVDLILNFNVIKGQRSEKFMTACNAMANDGFTREEVRRVLDLFPIGKKCKDKAHTFDRTIEKAFDSLEEYKQKSGGKKTVAQKLNDIHQERCEFYFNQYGDLMANIDGKHIKVGAGEFNDWIYNEFYDRYGNYPDNNRVASLKKHMAYKHREDKRQSYIRTANIDGEVTISLGDKKFVEVNEYGWQKKNTSNVSFIESSKMEPLPTPAKGGDIELLRKYVNVTDEQWPFMQAYILYCMHGKGPFPILVLTGSAGSAKTSTSRFIRSLIDPQVVKDLSLPYGIKTDTILLSSKYGYVLAYDNISSINREVSDTLCRIATGAGTTTRKLYTDEDEVITVVERPIILTGITDFIAGKEDLISRSLIVNLPRLENRRTEEELDKEFKADLPKILGGCLDLLSVALKRLPETTLKKPPRMADFAKFVKAIAPEIGLDPNTVVSEMLQEESEQQTSIVYESPVGAAIVKLMKCTSNNTWEGSVGDLLMDLQLKAGLLSDDAPTSRKLGDIVRRLANGLAAIGIAHTERRSNGKKLHVFTCE